MTSKPYSKVTCSFIECLPRLAVEAVLGLQLLRVVRLLNIIKLLLQRSSKYNFFLVLQPILWKVISQTKIVTQIWILCLES